MLISEMELGRDCGYTELENGPPCGIVAGEFYKQNKVISEHLCEHEPLHWSCQGPLECISGIFMADKKQDSGQRWEWAIEHRPGRGGAHSGYFMIITR